MKGRAYFRGRWRIAWLAMICILLLASITIVLPHAEAAHAAGPTLSVSPTSNEYAPIVIKVSGASYEANEAVKVFWNYKGPGTGIKEAAAKADATGAFTARFKIPLAATGTYTIAGVGQTSGFVATASFQLLPRLLANPQGGAAGAPITLSGNAFGAGEQVNIYWNYNGPGTGTLLTTAMGNSTGSFTANATVPNSPSEGFVMIAGVGQTSHTTGNYSFTVYPLTLALAPLNGSANSTLTTSGYGFWPTEKVNIYWNGSNTASLVGTTDDVGYLAPITMTVPDGVAPGIYPVKAVGQSSQFSVTTNFTVVAASSNLGLTSGPVGTNVSISGQGYAPNETVNIIWNYSGPGTGTSVASATAGSSGTIMTSFNVPTTTTGSYTVAAVGATSKQVSGNSFSLGNGLASNPASTPPGTNVTIAGTGFQTNETVTLYWDNQGGTVLATASADAQGNVNQAVTLPTAAAAGQHNVIGVGQTSGQSFTAPVLVNTNWSDFGFAQQHHRLNPYEQGLNVSTVASLKLRWTANEGAHFDNSPVAANGVVYITNFLGQLDAYNATTGTSKWHFDPGTGFLNYSSALVNTATNTVYYGAIAQRDTGLPSPFYALDAQTGSLKWSIIIPWSEFGFPTLAFNTIYVGTSDEAGPASLMAIDAVSGRVDWQYETNGGVWGAVGADPANNTVFTGVGNPSDQVVALNATTGAVIWQFNAPRFGPDDDIGTGIDVANGLVYADGKNGFVYALHESDGTLAWSTQTGTHSIQNVSSVAYASGTVYVGSLDTNLYALEANTGAVLWKLKTGAGIYSSPAVANGVVYVASLDKHLYAVNASSGAVLWSYNLGGRSLSSPVVVNGWVYCGAGNGKFYAFSR